MGKGIGDCFHLRGSMAAQNLFLLLELEPFELRWLLCSIRFDGQFGTLCFFLESLSLELLFYPVTW